VKRALFAEAEVHRAREAAAQHRAREAAAQHRARGL
jgi:hypothetical protein